MSKGRGAEPGHMPAMVGLQGPSEGRKWESWKREF